MKFNEVRKDFFFLKVMKLNRASERFVHSQESKNQMIIFHSSKVEYVKKVKNNSQKTYMDENVFFQRALRFKCFVAVWTVFGSVFGV